MKDNLTSLGSQARYHSNRLDQIDRLIHAAEADEDIAYLARLLALCSLPRTNPGNRKEYVRRNGPFTLALTAGFDNKLPYGYIAAAAAGLGVYRSGPDPKPGPAPWKDSVRFHARCRNRSGRGILCPCPEPDAAPLRLQHHPRLQRRNRMFTRVVLCGRPARILVEPCQARGPGAVAKRNPFGGGGFYRDHSPPGAAGHEHPEGAEPKRIGASISTCGSTTEPLAWTGP